ncbi:MAG: hypothetical protein MZV64_10030 [Ignavibacteriales bacterium]|nr:hypothetical protein [Ignavibacteriales bacterium]
MSAGRHPLGSCLVHESDPVFSPKSRGRGSTSRQCLDLGVAEMAGRVGRWTRTKGLGTEPCLLATTNNDTHGMCRAPVP